MPLRNKLLFMTVAVFVLSGCRNDEIIIGVVGDQFGSHSADKTYEIMQEGIDQLKLFSPDIVLHVGDMVESIHGVDCFEDYKAFFETSVSIMNELDCPWLLAIGDHDVVPAEYLPLSADRSRERWFLELVEDTELPIPIKPYYSYSLHGYHFIVLYSMENLHTDPRWGSIFLNKISEDQISWLKDELERYKRSKGVVVLVHHPHWYVWQNWQPVHDLLKNYNTRAVIAGHYHYDQDDGMIDGIRYLIMGSTGGVIKNTDIHTGSQEVGILKINRQGIKEIILIDIESGMEVEWTPRVTMDRVQAIECILDNLWQDMVIFSDGKEYYQSISMGNYEKLNQIELKSISNPIDVPITIEIKPLNDIYSNYYWLPQEDTILSPKIEFEPGLRSGWANYSSVGNWSPLSSVWVAELNNNDANNLSALQFEITITFYDTRKRDINKTINYYVNEIK